MADDARVREIDALAGFASDLGRAGTDLSANASRLAMLTFEKEAQVNAEVDRVALALHEAHEDLRRARLDYADYVDGRDYEDYSPVLARELQEEVEKARRRCDEIAGDLNEAQMIAREAMGRLNELRAMASAFGGRVQSLASSAADSVSRAARILEEYKNIR